MGFLDWKEEYGVGVNEMNEEHKHLIDLMNQLYDQNEKGSSKMVLMGCLKELGDSTVKHFKDEEAYMESIGYEDLKVHQKIHAGLLERFQKHVQTFEQGEGRVSREFFKFLRFWLVTHIKGIDVKYGHAQSKVA